MGEPDPIDSSYYQRRKILIAALALTTVCTQLTTILATQMDKPDKEKVQWNTTEIEHFIQYLIDHKSEGGDGGNFKARTLNAAALHIAPYRTGGLVKEAKHLLTKWTTVSDQHLMTDHCLYKCHR